jgi:hypothetical protein
MHVFVLMVYIGYGDGRALFSEDMYFYRADHCNSVANEVVKRYSTHGITLEDRVVAYCVPKYLEEIPENVY